MTDRRRYGVIEVHRVNSETFPLLIANRLWSEVEWSRSRRACCIQDAACHCLTHVEHIHATDRDPQGAIRLAKRMIVSGEMPSPEQANTDGGACDLHHKTDEGRTGAFAPLRKFCERF